MHAHRNIANMLPTLLEVAFLVCIASCIGNIVTDGNGMHDIGRESMQCIAEMNMAGFVVCMQQASLEPNTPLFAFLVYKY